MTGVDVHIDGQLKQNAESYTVTEDATPITPGDMTGGSGQITIGIPEEDETKLYRRRRLDLADGTQGVTRGVIRSMSSVDGSATLTADSRLVALNSTRNVQPFNGTLQDYFVHLLDIVGVIDGIVVDESLWTVPVIVPGFDGVVLDRIKHLCAAHQVEMTLASNNVVLRPVRGRVAENYRDSTRSWSIDDTQVAQSIEIFYYPTEHATGKLTYPLGGWNEDVTIIQVDAGEVLETEFALAPSSGDEGKGASLTSVMQPQCVERVDRYHDSSSVYAVVGNDGLPLEPQQWLDGGGKVEVSINEDTTSITVKVTGSSETQYAPYRLAMSAGTSDYYSSLRILGTGVFYEKKKLTLHTGNDVDRAPEEVGVTVENPMITDYETAWREGTRTLAAYTGPQQSISVTTKGINRRDDNGSYKYMTFGQYNALAGLGQTMGAFNALWPDSQFEDFNDAMFAQVRNDFANQAFGNIAGARVFDDGGWYRIRSASITPEQVSYQAEADNVFGDFTNFHGVGMTMAEFNDIASSRGMYEFADFSPVPLVRVKAFERVGSLPYPDTFYPDELYPA